MLRKKSILSLVLACITAVASSLQVMAYNTDADGDSIEEIEYHEINNENVISGEYDNISQVFAKIGSKYEVTIPKVIVLDGKEKKASYYIKANGDIAGYETIYIIPDESFDLYAKNKDEQEAIVTQDRISWSFTELDEQATGYINAPDITAGRWSGTFNFNLELNEEQVLGDIILPPDFEEEFDIDGDYKLLITKIQDKPGFYDEQGKLIISYEDLLNYYAIDPYVDNDFSIVYNPVEKEEETSGGGTPSTSAPEDEEVINTPSNITYTYGKIDEHSVSYIINNYFPETSYVSLPNGITSIGTANFAKTNLKYVYIPSTVEEIKDGAFADTKISFGYYPPSVKHIGSGIYYGTPAKEKVVYKNQSVKTIDIDLENNDEVVITLEKGSKYQITALYNFYDDVTKESTIKSSDPGIVKFTPDCFLDAIDCGTATISGTYFTKSGRQKEATIKVNVIEGTPKTNDVKVKPVTLEETDTAIVKNAGKIKMKILNVAAPDITSVDPDIFNKIKFTSDDENICRIVDGRIYALKEGKTKVHLYHTFTKQHGNVIEHITNEYIYDIVVSGTLNRGTKNDYENVSELAKDYANVPVGNYLDQSITFGTSLLTCDVYRVADNTVLTNSVFADCRKKDDDTQIIVGKNLSVAAGTTLTPPYRCKGVFIIDTGTFTNNGTISMTARGANAIGLDIPLVDDFKIDAVGGAGAPGSLSPKTPSDWSYYSRDGIAGSKATGISCGGGGSGGAISHWHYIATSAPGGAGTSFSGGSASGGVCAKQNSSIPTSTGGRGGDGQHGGFTCIVSGGAGNDAGTTVDAIGSHWSVVTQAQSGTGGLMIIVANNIINNGTLQSAGSMGGYAKKNPQNGDGGWYLKVSGGSSGGGCIVTIARSIEQNGNTNVAGGASVQSDGYNVKGGAGGAGTYKEIITNNLPF